jgi:hypothetical protein
MDPVLTNLARVKNHLHILNDIEMNFRSPECFSFLDRFYNALETAPHGELCELEFLGSLLRRRQTMLPSMKTYSRDHPDEVGEMLSGNHEQLALDLLRYHLAEVSHQSFFSDILWCADKEDREELDRLVEDFGRIIHRATQEELVEEYDLANLFYRASQSRVKPLVDALADRVMLLPSEDFVRIGIKTMIDGVTYIQMPERGPHPYHQYVPLLTRRLFDAMNVLEMSEVVALDNFAQLCNVLYENQKRTEDTESYFSQEALHDFFDRAQQHMASLSPREIDAVDPHHFIKRDTLRRLRRATQGDNIPPVMGKAYREFDVTAEVTADVLALEALEASRMVRPNLICDTHAMRVLANQGMFSDIEEILRNYLESPDDVFVGFNPSRFFRVIDGSDQVQTIGEAIDFKDLPPMVDPAVTEQFKQKLIRAFVAAPSLVDVNHASAMIGLIAKENPQFFTESVVPRLHKEMLGIDYIAPNARRVDSPSVIDRFIDRGLR